MQNENTLKPQHLDNDRNASMSDHDKQKTVSNPSPGSADPGGDNEPIERDTTRRNNA